MRPEDIKITDWLRILFGDTPYEFLIEVVIRILFIYILLVLSMRFMGRRMEAMITRNELIAMVSLAAAIGIPMLSPERGLLPAVVVAFVVVVIQHAIAYLTTRSAGKESALLDDISVLVENGILKPEVMKKSRITRERLLAQLRSSNIKNLGMVQRAYMEANGNFSIVQALKNNNKDTVKGLCVLPDFDQEYRNRFKFSEDAFACRSCGNVAEETTAQDNCDYCGAKEWEPAMVGA